MNEDISPASDSIRHFSYRIPVRMTPEERRIIGKSATALRQELAGFPDVQVSEVSSGGEPLFRVTVGRLPKGKALDELKRRLSAAGHPVFEIAAPGSAARLIAVHGAESTLAKRVREQPFGGNTLTQEIQRAFGMSPEEAEAAKRTGGLPDNYDAEVLAPFMDTLGLEVARALQFFFTSTQFNQVHHILLAGGCAAIPGIDEVVTRRTSVPSMVANPFANMALSSKIRPKNLATDAPSLMVACGLAMRRFDA